MPRVDFIEKTIFNIEYFYVNIKKDGRNVRSDAVLPINYVAERMTKNAMNVSSFREKFNKQFPGYDVDVLFPDGTVANGNTLLGTVRDRYLDMAPV